MGNNYNIKTPKAIINQWRPCGFAWHWLFFFGKLFSFAKTFLLGQNKFFWQFFWYLFYYRQNFLFWAKISNLNRTNSVKKCLDEWLAVTSKEDFPERKRHPSSSLEEISEISQKVEDRIKIIFHISITLVNVFCFYVFWQEETLFFTLCFYRRDSIE